MALQNSTENQTGRCSHLFHRMRVQMEKAIAVKAFRAGGRQPNTCADVNQGRNIELLCYVPEWLIGRMIEVAIVDRVRCDEQAAMAKFRNRALRLLDRQLWFLKRDHRNSKQSLFIRRTMLGQPIVIRAK